MHYVAERLPAGAKKYTWGFDGIVNGAQYSFETFTLPAMPGVQGFSAYGCWA
ncbi:MAG: hypothetical protein ACLP01_04080 [Solirubrobacteraceae bacterium]